MIKYYKKQFKQALAELPVMAVQKYKEWLKERINIFEEELKLKGAIMDEGQIRKKYNITGCEHCPYFVEVVIKEGEQRPGQKSGWRQYCGKGNFNINRASYVVTKTSHNKNKVVPENHYEWEYAFPNRCPLRKENF